MQDFVHQPYHQDHHHQHPDLFQALQPHYHHPCLITNRLWAQQNHFGALCVMMMRVLPHMTWVKRAFIGLLRTFSGWSLYFTPTNKKFSIAPLIFATAASRSKVVIHLFTVSPITEKTVIFALRSNESLSFVCVLLVFHVVPIALSLPPLHSSLRILRSLSPHRASQAVPAYSSTVSSSHLHYQILSQCC